MNTPDRTALKNARDGLSQAHSAAARLMTDASVAAAGIETLQRTLPPDDSRLKTAREHHQELVAKLKAARAEERDARTKLFQALSDWLPAEPEDEVERLSAEFPILLLPVRIETRFDQSGGHSGQPQLKVRIYPDDIFADTHEEELTQQECEDGLSYWKKANETPAGRAESRDAWRGLLARYSAERAAWIVRQTAQITLCEPVEKRAGKWTRAAVAYTLPDRWLVVAYRDGQKFYPTLSGPVREPLALTHDPMADDGDDDETLNLCGEDLRVDAEVAWTFDFALAEQAGMAVTIPLVADDLRLGFDQLLVVGVKSSLTEVESSERLAKLLDAHHFTRGLAFERQGTPTNNTESGPSGFPPEDLDGNRSFDIERGAAPATPDRDFDLFARMLGIGTRLDGHLDGASRTEQRNAREMNNALWPVTLGYYLEQMWAPVFNSDAIAQTRDHFVDHVSARGLFSAFRVGGTPYGLLPVTSLTHWQPRGEATGIEMRLPPLLIKLREIWVEQIPKIPRIGRTDDPDAQLLEVLGMDASIQQIRVRDITGSIYQGNMFGLLYDDWEGVFNEQESIVKAVMAKLGHPELNPRVLWTTLSDSLPLHKLHLPLHLPLVAALLSEEEGLPKIYGGGAPKNFLEVIRDANEQDLRTESFITPGLPRPNVLLYVLLRHAAMTEYWRAGFRFLLESGYITEAERVEPELVKIVGGTENRLTVWENFNRNIPPQSSIKLRDIIFDPENPAPELPPYRASLDHLARLSTAELDRLTAETLDLCSHRLDAWITSLSNKRLKQMRHSRPDGIHLGAFGWVENLHPEPVEREVTLPDGRRARVQSSSGGYIHAPSMNHAAAAAVLRNAHLSRTGETESRYAIDLSSERVRAALFLLDAVRQGQPLGAVLGYRFERGLHEGHRPLQLDKYIEPFRLLFPLIANKSGEQSTEPVETLAARNVVDGLALRKAWREGRQLFGHTIGPLLPGSLVNTNGLPIGGPDKEAIEVELRRLDEMVDGVADLLTAESIYHIIGGGVERAVASLETMGAGTKPPDPQIARMPQSGTSLTHRVAAVLGGDASIEAPGWGAVPASPRSIAEPRLNGWVGALLGNPDNIWCRVKRPSPMNGDPDIVRLRQLRLQPLDLLALAVGVKEKGLESELDRRVLYFSVGFQVAQVEIIYTPDENWDRKQVRSFSEILELARTINQVLGGARPLRPADLMHPQAKANDADLLADDALQRAKDAVAALAIAIGRLESAKSDPDLNTLRDELIAASLYGVIGAFPLNRDGSDPPLRDQLVAQADRALMEMNRRKAESEKRISEAAESEENPQLKLEKSVEAFREIFGRDFILLPKFKLSNPDELNQAFNVVIPGDRSNAIGKWLRQASHARPALDRWRRLFLYADALGDYASALGAGSARYDVAQLPHAEGERWVALKFGNEDDRPPAGRLSLALHRPVAPATDAAWVGLQLDEWSEIIPRPSEATSFAFNYDDAGAEAPQTLLLAVPPAGGQTWELETLLDILRETLELAKLRAVDSRMLTALSQILPAIYLASNAADDTISTDISSLKMANPRINLSGSG